MINKSLLREHQKIDSNLNVEYNNVYFGKIEGGSDMEKKVTEYESSSSDEMTYSLAM